MINPQRSGEFRAALALILSSTTQPKAWAVRSAKQAISEDSDVARILTSPQLSVIPRSNETYSSKTVSFFVSSRVELPWAVNSVLPAPRLRHRLRRKASPQIRHMLVCLFPCLFFCMLPCAWRWRKLKKRKGGTRYEHPEQKPRN